MSSSFLSVGMSASLRLACVFCLLGALHETSQAETTFAEESLPVPNLSIESLEALTVNIAIYDDATVEQILQAAQQPSALHDASTGATVSADWSAGLKALLAYPALLKQLDQDLPYTARLGVASQNQLNDVWTAIDSVRVKLKLQAASSQPEPELAEQPADQVTYVGTTYVEGNTVGYPAIYYPYAGVVARTYWTRAVWNELNQATNINSTTATYTGANGQTATATSQVATAEYHNATTDAAVGAGATTFVGPNGNTAYAQGIGAAGTTTVGDTTYGGAAASGSITGSNGNAIHGAGQATGSVTQTSQGYSYESQSSGAYTSNFGSEGTFSHHQEGSITSNADGSTSFDRSSGGNFQATNGQGSFTHNGSGTYTGDGTGSYQGSSSINTGQGSVQTSTTAGDGQASTTVVTGSGTSTYTAGDQQIGSTSRQAANQTSSSRFGQSSSTARPSSSVRNGLESTRQSMAKGRLNNTPQNNARNFSNRGANQQGSQSSLRAKGNSFSRNQSSWNQARGGSGYASGQARNSSRSHGVRSPAADRSGMSRGGASRGGRRR